MAEQAGQRVAGDAVPPAERLVNLTEHEIVVESQLPPDAGGEWGSPEPSAMRIQPAGGSARVDDDRAELGGLWVNASADLVRVTRLRRSRRVVGLPAAEPGVRYLVSRVTALAARHRGDLVFPFGEEREGGRVVRVRGVAAFPRRWAPGERYRDWREAVRERRLHAPLGAPVLTGVLFAGATALLSGALGLAPGVLDNTREHGWAGGGQVLASWLTVGFGIAGAGLLGLAAWRWRQRGVILESRGTAYVIEEQAIAWRHEEKASVLAVIGEEFAGVLRVPGPEALGESWRWQADAGGAPQWDARADELVRSFWSVHYNDDQVTFNAVFTWAPWPVAMAFGARATARRRGLVLHVRQRPSYGAGGPRQHLQLTDGAHDFLRIKKARLTGDIIPDHEVQTGEGQVTVTLTTLEGGTAGGAGQPGAGTGAAAAGRAGQAGAAGIVLLTVRLVDEPIGDIPVGAPAAGEVPVSVAVSLAGSVIPLGTRAVRLAQWRLAAAGPAVQVPWPAFPAVAEAIADWVSGQAAAHPGHVVLLAARIPQELAVGLGIQLGQRAGTWPGAMYPVYFTGGRLVVPDLRLGAESVSAERT